MSEKRFTTVSMGREEAYCDFSIIKVGDKIISEIPTTDAIRICDLLNEKQSIISNQEQKIKILQQEINDTQAILEMQSEKLKGWNDE